MSNFADKIELISKDVCDAVGENPERWKQFASEVKEALIKKEIHDRINSSSNPPLLTEA